MLSLEDRCTRRRRAAGILALAAAVAYSVLVFHPEIGCLLVRAWTAAATLLLGVMYYRYQSIPCTRVEGDEEYRREIVEAPIG